ncbi:MAG: 23S rRNA (adenine(2030)-N(6))-methyltransferase RlmJ, partial [Arenimonas sp.]
PYEAQEGEFVSILAALKEGLARWPTGMFAVWYPIKQRRTLLPFLRKAALLPCKSALIAEILVRPDDSPLRLNGSGMLVINPPYQLDQELAPALPVLARLMGDKHHSSSLQWIKKESP